MKHRSTAALELTVTDDDYDYLFVDGGGRIRGFTLGISNEYD